MFQRLVIRSTAICLSASMMMAANAEEVKPKKPSILIAYMAVTGYVESDKDGIVEAGLNAHTPTALTVKKAGQKNCAPTIAAPLPAPLIAQLLNKHAKNFCTGNDYRITGNVRLVGSACNGARIYRVPCR